MGNMDTTIAPFISSLHEFSRSPSDILCSKVIFPIPCPILWFLPDMLRETSTLDGKQSGCIHATRNNTHINQSAGLIMVVTVGMHSIPFKQTNPFKWLDCSPELQMVLSFLLLLLFSHVISCYSYIQSLQWTNNIASANPSLARHPSIYRKGGLCWLPLLSNTCCHCCFKHEKSPTLAKKQVPSSASWFRNVRCTIFVSKPFCLGYSLKTIGYYFFWKQCLVI